MDALDFYGQGDNRTAVFDWTKLSKLDSKNCNACNGIRFGGQLFSNVLFYFGEGQRAVYWVIGTQDFNKNGKGLKLTSQGYVSPEHEDLEFPTMAAEGLPFQDGGNGGAIMSFTLSGNGGPAGADNGGFFPSSAFGRLTATSGGLLGPIHISDLGQSPQDGFSEYQGFPGGTRPRWGDYGNAIFVPFTGGKIYFATNYIQFPNCTGADFTLTLPTCGGTRDVFANWGTSVNYVTP